ncbi:MAG TPA: ATP-binding protein [Candidatus Glassbacteria bacterium]|nr:ATP-binding protein [Candidatus Glassbacteria bacterium]
MNVKITRYDIGAEIISILTKGMYPEPCDALREYVQNGIDANAKNIEIKIRTNSIVVEDDGLGMDAAIIKKAIRIGISDKNPNIDVGFRGIGIYSSFHLCDNLQIYSKTNSSNPHILSFNFKKMRQVLMEQQIARLNGTLSGDDLIDLQSLLEEYIDLKELKPDEFPKMGTRVEMINLHPSFEKALTNFENVAEYLRQVAPLHFDSENFKWAKAIEDKITQICEKNNAEFKLVNINLQVGTRAERLYRPYSDSCFDEDPIEPYFHELKRNGNFFGVAWGCLNPLRKKISDKELRGFLIRKQGFAIGKRTNVSKYFGRTTYFDRFIGEIIVVHPELLPNAPRTDFELSPLRAIFYEALTEIAGAYNEQADRHQEFTKGDELLDKSIENLKKIEASISFYSENTEKLVDIIIDVRKIYDQIAGRIKRKVIRQERVNEAKQVIKSAGNLEKEIQNFLKKARKVKRKIIKGKSPEVKSIERIKKLPETKGKKIVVKDPTNLAEVFDLLDLLLSDQLRSVIEIIDEKFVQASASNKSEYLLILKTLRDEIEDLLSEE